MKQRSRLLALIFSMIVISLIVAGCATESASTGEDEITVAEESSAYEGQKVLFVNSYHSGYAWSDGIYEGLTQELEGTGVEVMQFEMDTKRNTDEAFRENAAQEAFAAIEEFQPDVIVTADDNAQNYLVVPYLMDSDYPILFVGVNWDASIYGFPTEHITGMVEIELVEEMVAQLSSFTDGETIGYITVGSETERKVAEVYNDRFFNNELVLYEVDSWEGFQEAFMTAQSEVDMVFIGNNAGIDWPEDEAAQFFTENTLVPTGSINDWMAPYALLTLAKSPQEQGEWAGQAVLSLLDGTSISDIPVVENKRGDLILNLDIADRMDVVFAPTMLKNAQIYEREAAGG